MKTKNIVIIGGGFGGIYTAKYLIKKFKRNPYVKITLINKENYFIFTPMLHEVATGGLNRRSIVEPIREAVRGKNFTFLKDIIKKIDLKKQKVYGEHNAINYDYLVVATGSKTIFFNIPGAEKFTIPLKSLNDAQKIKNKIIERFEEATKYPKKAKSELTFVIAGGGPTGVELAGELAEFVDQLVKRSYWHLKHIKPRIILVNKANSVLKHARKKVQKEAIKALKDQGVELMLNSVVTNVTKESIQLNKKKTIKTKSIFWATGVTPNGVKTTPNILDKRGHLPTNAYLYHDTYKNIFALGDTSLQLDPKTLKAVPNLAQVAVGQAAVAANNIFQRITGAGQLQTYSFKSKGFLVSVGRYYAIADLGSLKLTGFIAWFIWRTVYLSKLLSYNNKIRTAIDWTLDFFWDRDITEIE